MKNRSRTRPALLAAVLAVVGGGCAAAAAGGSRTGANAAYGGGFEFERADLSSGTNLLATLEPRIPNFGVLRSEFGCPRISLRGVRSFHAEPTVYVNGTRMVNTCALEQISVQEVERVGVYSVATTRHPGLSAGPGGLIVVELRTS